MFKIVIAFFVVLGAIVWGQRYAGTWITQQVADMPPRDDFLPQPTKLVPTIDPGQISRSLNTPGYYPGIRR
jgi:hypothetical protein